MNTMKEHALSTTNDDAAGRGVELVQACLRAAAEGDESAVLAAINGADLATSRWATGYLVSVVRESIGRQVKGHPQRVARLLRASADGCGVDAATVRADVRGAP